MMHAHARHRHAPGIALWAALALVPLAGQEAAAQSAEEAAAQNIQLAITLCVRNGHDLGALRAAFAGSGHSHTPEDFGGGVVLHHYGTPDATVTTTVTQEQGVNACRIATDLYGVSQMIPFSRAVLDQLYEGPIWDESPEGATITPGSPQAAGSPCSGFHILPGRTVIWFTFGNAGQDPVCVDNGTAQIMISL